MAALLKLLRKASNSFIIAIAIYATPVWAVAAADPRKKERNSDSSPWRMCNSFVGSLHKHKVHFYSFYSQSQLHKREVGGGGETTWSAGRRKNGNLTTSSSRSLRFKETQTATWTATWLVQNFYPPCISIHVEENCTFYKQRAHSELQATNNSRTYRA